MVIAMTHDNGNIGEHFGHAEEFKLYELDGRELIDSAVVSPFGSGHEAVVATMADYNVSYVICNHIGDGAMKGLQSIGINYIPNVTGSCDDALEAFLSGNMTFEVNPIYGGCDCDGDCGSDCGGGCGGCCH